MSAKVYDWTVLDELGEYLDWIVDRAVRKLRMQSDGRDASHIDKDDAQQDAYVLLAGNAERVRLLAADESWGYISSELYRDLQDKYETETRRAHKHVSAEERYADTEEHTQPYAPFQQRESAKGGYTSDLVEQLLPAVWDADFCYGVRVETAPDSDMPRAATNKATGNTLAAHIADIKTGWERTDLTLKERRALFLRFALDWDLDEIGRHEGTAKSNVSVRLRTAVGKVATCLNNNPYYQLPPAVGLA